MPYGDEENRDERTSESGGGSGSGAWLLARGRGVIIDRWVDVVFWKAFSCNNTEYSVPIEQLSNSLHVHLAEV